MIFRKENIKRHNTQPLTWFDKMQFYQKVGQYHLTGTDIVIRESEFICVISGANSVGSSAKFHKL